MECGTSTSQLLLHNICHKLLPVSVAESGKMVRLAPSLPGYKILEISDSYQGDLKSESLPYEDIQTRDTHSLCFLWLTLEGIWI